MIFVLNQVIPFKWFLFWQMKCLNLILLENFLISCHQPPAPHPPYSHKLCCACRCLKLAPNRCGLGGRGGGYLTRTSGKQPAIFCWPKHQLMSLANLRHSICWLFTPEAPTFLSRTLEQPLLSPDCIVTVLFLCQPCRVIFMGRIFLWMHNIMKNVKNLIGAKVFFLDKRDCVEHIALNIIALLNTKQRI